VAVFSKRDREGCGAPLPPPPHRLIFFKFVKYSGRGSSVDGDPSTKYRWWIGNSTD
jgi:hypothetical protein